ncbi:hypothetical protein BDK51DRAFT_44393 [Blyttiomyces helicus]|uniref:Uncharacterized protein n=1 Tax=Blyttiomyces helicus TaxID=388810 RepID=A0A4P9WK41_9FUNG|nr:hypothetical protein BDK51DRAFT_44393 [Blyttiomyces helicus]|eukprot:RKO92343.1 hypothetical protein BDK51DRAFT_44393 [Blyttiomyces helicus]
MTVAGSIFFTASYVRDALPWRSWAWSDMSVIALTPCPDLRLRLVRADAADLTEGVQKLLTVGPSSVGRLPSHTVPILARLSPDMNLRPPAYDSLQDPHRYRPRQTAQRPRHDPPLRHQPADIDGQVRPPCPRHQPRRGMSVGNGADFHFAFLFPFDIRIGSRFGSSNVDFTDNAAIQNTAAALLIHVLTSIAMLARAGSGLEIARRAWLTLSPPHKFTVLINVDVAIDLDRLLPYLGIALRFDLNQLTSTLKSAHLATIDVTTIPGRAISVGAGADFHLLFSFPVDLRMGGHFGSSNDDGNASTFTSLPASCLSTQTPLRRRRCFCSSALPGHRQNLSACHRPSNNQPLVDASMRGILVARSIGAPISVNVSTTLLFTDADGTQTQAATLVNIFLNAKVLVAKEELDSMLTILNEGNVDKLPHDYGVTVPFKINKFDSSPSSLTPDDHRWALDGREVAPRDN